ncbi:hypothetical protein PENTCL1PPCAC_23857, partial [Pristionchus entomophagus]
MDCDSLQFGSSSRLPEHVNELKIQLLRHVNSNQFNSHFDEELGSKEDLNLHNLVGNDSLLLTRCRLDNRQEAQQKKLFKLTKKTEIFPLLSVVSEITTAIRSHDVVMLIAPTGSGKSILAPFIAERILEPAKNKAEKTRPNVKLFRKSLMIVPSAEHCGNTVRSIDK